MTVFVYNFLMRIPDNCNELQTRQLHTALSSTILLILVQLQLRIMITANGL